MSDLQYIEGQQFNRQDYKIKPLARAEYEQCEFISCDFSASAVINCQFIDCIFRDCNLSLLKADGAAFRNVSFMNCKMLGIRFDQCDPFLFSIRPEGCTLDCSSFYKMKLKKTLFTNCSMRELDFTGTDLTQAAFDKCDLEKTLFDQTILARADLRTSTSFQIDPEKNNLKKMKVSVNGLPGLLGKFDLDIRPV